MQTEQYNITPMNASHESYIRHGWKLCPIPAGTKGPTTPNWNAPENALTLDNPLPDGNGVGLLHAYSGTCAIDIDDYAMARSWLNERGVNIDQLFLADNAVHINSGNPGHAKLLYTLPIPFQSKKVIIEGKTVLELRCASANGKSVQDVLPPSRHPSGTVYQWGGNGNWQRLPELPLSLMSIWQTILNEDADRTLPMGVAVPANMNEVRAALFSLDPDCDRKTWIEVGMALNQVGQTVGKPEYGFQLWNEWSSQGKKYPGEKEIIKQWLSFKPIEKGITVNTLFHHAYATGWRRPAEDVTGMFAPVKDKTVEDIKQLVSPGARIPNCDLSMWPEQLLNRSLEVSVQVGCDPVVPLIAGLCAVSCAVDKRTKLILSDTWRVPPTIWTMTVGEPADKKTPGSKPMFVPLQKLEIEDRPRFDAEMMTWQGKEARYASQMKAYREFMADPASEMPNTEGPKVEALPLQPEPLRLLVNDATTQKVITLAQHRPRGFLLWLDEMNNWFNKIGNPRNTDDRGCWIQGYETGHYTMDRMGAGSIRVDNFALSIYGNCQPEVFRRHAKETSTDGLLQRFIPVVLNPVKNAMWEEGRPAFMSHDGEYEQLIRRTYALPVFEYVLSEEAMASFRLFCEWAIKLRSDERLVHSSASYNTALGKLEGNCSRIALLFHIIEEPYSPVMSIETMNKAIALVKKFFYPMLRYTFITVGQQRDEMGQVLIDYIIQCASVRTVVTMSELRRATRSATGYEKYEYGNDQSIRAVMEELISDGWASYLQDHPRHPQFAINPELATVYQTHRQEVIRAKQAIIDSIGSDLGVEMAHAAIGRGPIVP